MEGNMKTVNVYKQYFRGECSFNGRERHGVQVRLTAESDSGNITCDVSVNFFPHDSEDDFAVSYDAEKSVRVYSSKGRRSKKREEELMKELRTYADEAAHDLSGRIFWDESLTEPQYS